MREVLSTFNGNAMMKRACVLLFVLMVAVVPLNAQQAGSVRVNATSGSLDAASEAVTVFAGGNGSVGFQITGTFTATVSFEGTVDGSTWAALTLTSTSGAGSATTATAAGLWTGAASGLQAVRARVSSYTSGTAVVSVRVTPFGGGSGGSGGGGGGDASAANQTTQTAHLSEIEAAIEALQADVATFNSSERFLSAGAVEEFEVKAAAGTLMGFSASNSHATDALYLKCSDATAANTTPGTTAIVFDVLVPPGGRAEHEIGMSFANGLTCYAVTGAADSDTTAVAANNLRVTWIYR